MVRNNLRIFMLIGLLLSSVGAATSEPLRIVATVPDLGELSRAVGGDKVQVKVLAKPTEDPHFVDPRPSFVKAVNQADFYIQLGLDMEAGWAPVLLKNARNPEVLPGRRGYLDTSVAISPLGVPLVPVDRSFGDVHPLGNPHYLTDPIEGLRVARLIRKHLQGIINAVVLRVTNAGAESVNAIIQRVKARACGYRNRDRFRRAIMFYAGGLDLRPTV